MVTETKFLEMDDRERDAWVAENIMGWTDVKLEDLGLPYWSEDWDFVGCPPELNGEPDTVYQYSTDYNAMYRVVEKMQADGWAVIMSVPHVAEAENKCRIIGDFFSGEDYPVFNADLRLAVYLAAGRALGRIE